MIAGINHITLAVKDIEKSFAFYKMILGFKPLVKWDKGAYFLAGEGDNSLWFCLNADENRVPNSCYTHYAFSVSGGDFDLVVARIKNAGISLFKENTSPGDSLYFLDPDGHKLEIHTGSCDERIFAKKENPGDWKNVEWFV